MRGNVFRTRTHTRPALGTPRMSTTRPDARPSERGRAWDPILITRPLSPDLNNCEKAWQEKGPAREESCDNILVLLRGFLRESGSSDVLPEHVFRTLAETSRCDHIYGEQMRVVRSRVCERLGPQLYSETISKMSVTDPQKLDEVRPRAQSCSLSVN